MKKYISRDYKLTYNVKKCYVAVSIRPDVLADLKICWTRAQMMRLKVTMAYQIHVNDEKIEFNEYFELGFSNVSRFIWKHYV